MYSAYTIIIAILILAGYVYLGAKKPAFALITSPIITLLCAALFISALDNNNAPPDYFMTLIVAMLVFPAAISAIVISQPSGFQEQWPRVWARWASLILFYTVLLVLLVAVFWPLGFLFWGAIVALTVRHKTSLQYTTALHVVSTIGAAIRQNLPLAMALESASGTKEKWSKALEGISHWLSQGYPLSQAVRRGYPTCPSDVLAMIAAAEKMDQLPLAMESIEADLLQKADESKKIKPVHMSYPLIVLTVAGCVAMGLSFFIVPTFAEVLMDLTEGQPLPKSTMLLLNFADLMSSHDGLVFFVIASLVILVWCFAAYLRFRQRRPDRPFLASKIGDLIKWYLPISHWFERNYALLQCTQLLRSCLRAGRTVNEAVAAAVYLDVNNCFRKRLVRWLKRIEAGQNISEAGRQTGLGSAIAWAFDDKVNRGNTPEILGMLEEFYRHSYNYRVNLARSVCGPAIVLGLGAVVGFIVYAMFMPMVAILDFFGSTVLP